MQAPPACPPLQWDIFCRVIDNFGDVGVCWRLAVNLTQHAQAVRLWLDDPSALQWLAPQGAPGVEVRSWTTPLPCDNIAPGDVLVEAFGCEIDAIFIASYANQIRARGTNCLWINLEYLSAEAYVRRCHGLPSPVLSGAGKGLTKHFFYPGFTVDTGGLMREPDLMARRAAFDRTTWLARLPPRCAAATAAAAPTRWRWISLFCYEPPALDALLTTLAQDARPTQMLVTAGRASAAVKAVVEHKNTLKPNWNKREQLFISYLPQLSQVDFDHMLWACDLNFVRGEDSLVRALWAGQALVWQIYPQDDGAHAAKLEAFLDWLQAPPELRAWHHRWNDLARGLAGSAQADLPLADLSNWQQTTAQARAKLLAQDDLASQLLGFVAKNL